MYILPAQNNKRNAFLGCYYKTTIRGAVHNGKRNVSIFFTLLVDVMIKLSNFFFGIFEVLQNREQKNKQTDARPKRRF